MVVVTKDRRKTGIWIHGKIGHAYEHGVRRYGEFLYGEEEPLWGIYQTRRLHGKIWQIREKHFEPKFQNQPNKVARQNVMRDGMIAWHALTDAQRLAYHKKGTKLRMHGHNVFIRQYLRSH